MEILHERELTLGEKEAIANAPKSVKRIIVLGEWETRVWIVDDSDFMKEPAIYISHQSMVADGYGQ